MSFVSQFAHYLEASHRLGNPFHVLLRRTIGEAHEYMAIEDRESGVRCRCTIGSYHMFGETWYLQAYDVPRVPIRQGDAVLDIGANQGFFTCYAAHRGARVYAFEPNPESYETLLSNVERNGFADRVEAKPWAIADKQGIGELIVSNELGGGMSTINPEFARNARITPSKTLEVPLDTLAHVLDVLALPRLRLCKVDAEGSEIEVLRTLCPRHLAVVDSFALEIHPEAYPLQDLMALVLAWGTHQIGFKDESRFSPVVVRLISNRVLSDGAGVR